jgi:hypothetical protein
MSWWKYVGGLSPGPAAIPNLANPSGLAARRELCFRSGRVGRSGRIRYAEGRGWPAVMWRAAAMLARVSSPLAHAVAGTRPTGSRAMKRKTDNPCS